MATNGNRGKFAERIKKIASRKRNRKKVSQNTNFSYTDVLKVLLAVPGMVRSNLDFERSNREIDTENNLEDINETVDKKKKLYANSRQKNRKNKLNNIDNIKNEQNIKKEKIVVSRGQDAITNFSNDVNNNSNANVVSNDIFDIRGTNRNNESKFDIQNINSIDKTRKLEKEIIDLIKKKLVFSINNLEILQSELYILSEINGDQKTVLECERQIKEIKRMLKEINKMKEQYDFLRDNYDFEYLTAFDDNNLIDKILELKEIFSNNQMRELVKDYKLLDEYKYLYLKIDKMQEKMYDLEDKKHEQALELKKRDIDFEHLKNRVVNVDNINKSYEQFADEQNALINSIDENVSKIDSYEQVDYHLKGFNKLLFNSFKYFGLLMLSPLRGIFPSIAAEALITRDIVRNLYGNLKWEEERKIVYNATDYSRTISNTIDDMDIISGNIDLSLSEIINLKHEYHKKFEKYQIDFVEYREVINKIEKLENKMLGNKIKIEILKERALVQKKENDKKMSLIKKMNDEANNK